MPSRQAWLAAALVFLTVALATVVVALLVEWATRRRRERGVAAQLERLSVEALDTMAPGAGAVLRREAPADSAWVRALSSRVPHLRRVQILLDQAALHWTVRSYLTFACGTALALALAVLGLSGRALYAASAGAIGLTLPYLYVSHRRAARLARFEELFPGAVDLLGRAMRAGHPLSAALQMVAEEVDDPVASEFRLAFEEHRFGLPFAESLVGLSERVPSPDVRIFVTAVLIQREVGGNLTELLDHLADIIRQRFTLRRQVRVLTAEGRYSVYVLTVLPFAVGGFVFFTNRAYLAPLWQTEVGRLLLYGALLAQVAGYVWMRRITRVEL